MTHSGIDLKYLPKDDMFQLLHPLRCKVERREYIIPSRFLTDGFTMKRWGRSFVPRMNGKYFRAAVLHDWMYVTAYANKKFADKMFYKYLLLLGMPKIQAKIYYYAVRIGGKGNY